MNDNLTTQIKGEFDNFQENNNCDCHHLLLAVKRVTVLGVRRVGDNFVDGNKDVIKIIEIFNYI